MTEPVKLDLAAIRTRADAAPKGPWRYAIMDPPTAIALLDMVERLTRERDRANALCAEHHSEAVYFEAERDRLRNRIRDLVDAAS